MLRCQFCGSDSQQQYLYTSCNHFICTTCAFQKAEFTSQTIQCCDEMTSIDEESMSMIIRSRRMKNSIQTAQEKIREVEYQEIEHREKYEKNNMVPIFIEPPVFTDQPMAPTKPEYSRSQILNEQIDKLRRYFKEQHEKLRQKEQEQIRLLVKAFDEPVKDHQMLQKTNDSHFCSQVNPISQSVTSEHRSSELRKSRMQFDYIIKRLQLNEERMNEKLAKHEPLMI